MDPVWVAAANVTAACNLAAAWDDSRPGLVVLSEARVRHGGAAETALAAARRAGGQMLLGPADPSGVALLAAFASVGVLREGPFADACAACAGRLASWLWVLPGCVVAVFGVYGTAGRGDDPAGHNAQLVLQAAAWAEELGGPALIVGDCNVHDGHDAWACTLGAAGWLDVGGRDPVPTCRPSRGLPSRPDRILASPLLAAAFGAVHVDWGTGLPVHAVLRAALHVPAGRAVLRARPGVALAGAPRAGWPAVEAAASAAAEARWEAAGAPALAAGRLAEAWAALEAAVTGYLAERAGVTAGPRRRLRWERQLPPAGRGGEALSRAAAAALRRARRLQALAAQWPPGPGALPHHLLRVLDAAARAEPLGSPWRARLAGIRSADTARSAAEDAGAEALAAASRERAGRRARWRAFVEEELAAGGARVYAWLRGGLSDAGGPTARPDGTLTGDAGESVLLVQAAWASLWCPGGSASPDTAFEAALAALPRFPEAPPSRVTPCAPPPWPRPRARRRAATAAPRLSSGCGPGGLSQPWPRCSPPSRAELSGLSWPPRKS